MAWTVEMARSEGENLATAWTRSGKDHALGVFGGVAPGEDFVMTLGTNYSSAEPFSMVEKVTVRLVLVVFDDTSYLGDAAEAVEVFLERGRTYRERLKSLALWETLRQQVSAGQGLENGFHPPAERSNTTEPSPRQLAETESIKALIRETEGDPKRLLEAAERTIRYLKGAARVAREATPSAYLGNDAHTAPTPVRKAVPGDNGPDSPILIDVARDGLNLVGLDDPVVFDLDGDGSVEQVTWTAAIAEDAFLVLDRDGDGKITSGQELFGSHTPQPDHPSPNGFEALAWFDRPVNGGNGDGKISAQDEIFPLLRLWTDRNHDGHSQTSELSRLDENSISAIELRYIETRRTDSHGNQYRWASLVRFDRGSKLAAVDVIFQRVR